MTAMFAIIAGPRTGSTAIQNFLEDLGVFVFREPFRPSKGTFDISARLNEIYFGYKAVGMKHLYTHVDILTNQAIANWLFDRGISVVLLKRKRKFDQAISLAIAKYLNVWEVNHHNKEDVAGYNDVQPFGIEPGEIHSQMKWLTTVEENIDATTKPLYVKTKTFFYEDLFSPDYDTSFLSVHGMLKFIKIKPPDYTTQMINEHFDRSHKQNKPSFYEKIINYKELREEFDEQ